MALIIDTDIGSDVDDAIALAYAARAGIDVKLITTVHGPTRLRANIAKRMALELGLDTKVAWGECKPLKQTHIFLTGLEGKCYAAADDDLGASPNAVELLAETVYANPGIDIAAIGPLTNIAKAFQNNPGLAEKIGHIYVMGNCISLPHSYHLNYRSHNLKVDPEAADIVFQANVKKTIITTEICKKNYFTKQQLMSLGGNPALDYIRNSALEWMDFIKYDVAYLYDPLVVQHALIPGYTKVKSYGNVYVATDVPVDFSAKALSIIMSGKK